MRDDRPEIAKYLTSPTTSIFRKSETFYGMERLDELGAAGEAIVAMTQSKTRATRSTAASSRRDSAHAGH